MDRQRMIIGWERAAKKLLAQKPRHQEFTKMPTLSFEQVAEIAATRHRIAIAMRKKPRTTVHSELSGTEFGLLLAWERRFNGDNPMYDCLCACGNGEGIIVEAHKLLSGRKRDCGCRKAERARLRAWRRRQKLAKIGRKRGHWKRFVGMKAA
jgi:hypothetical protein